MEPRTWYIIHLVLSGIMIKPLCIIWVIALCVTRRKNDPSRVAFSYMKVIMPLAILGMLFYLVADALFIVSDDRDDPAVGLNNATVRATYIGGLWTMLANVFLLVCLSELGAGFLYCISQRRGAVQKTLRYGSLALGLVPLALFLAYFGKANAAYTDYFRYLNHGYDDSYGDYYGSDDDSDDFDPSSFEDALKVARNLVTAVDILLFASSIGSLVLSIVVVVKIQRHVALRNSGVIFLVVTILNSIRYLWSVIYDAAWLIPDKVAPTVADNIIDPILNFWVLFVLLMLVFVIGLRKQTGLWTTQQPWMGGAPPPVLAAQSHAFGAGQVAYVQMAPVYGQQGYPQQQPVEQGWQGQQVPQHAPHYQQGLYYYPQEQELTVVANGRAPVTNQQVYHDPK